MTVESGKEAPNTASATTRWAREIISAKSTIVWAKSQDSVRKPQFLKRKESRSGSNRGPSAYQPSALPPGHTGSQELPVQQSIFLYLWKSLDRGVTPADDSVNVSVVVWGMGRVGELGLCVCVRVFVSECHLPFYHVSARLVRIPVTYMISSAFVIVQCFVDCSVDLFPGLPIDLACLILLKVHIRLRDDCPHGLTFTWWGCCGLSF